MKSIDKRIIFKNEGDLSINSKFNEQLYNKQHRQMTAVKEQNISSQIPQIEHLNLKVKSQDGQEVFFKIKSSTQLKKLMDAYCQRQGLASTNVRFLFDGERLHETQTPKQMSMENGDQIDVLVEQVGGS